MVILGDTMKILFYSLIAVLSTIGLCQADPPSDKLPLVFRYRCSKELRLTAIKNGGGLPASEEAVQKALHFLRDQQNSDGSWSESQPVGMTGLALLCFLGHGETAQSDEFGVCVLNAIQYLVDLAAKNGGKLGFDFKDHHWIYEHAIATQALAEAYLICEVGFGEQIPKLKEMAEESGRFMIRSQHNAGSWDYAYSQDSARAGDVSQTSWHLLALASCHQTKLQFKGLLESYQAGVDYIEKNQMPSGAIGYSSPNLHGGTDGTTLCASGAYCAQLIGKPGQKIVRKALPFLARNMKFGWDTADSDLYGHFFASMVIQNNGGKIWKDYHKVVFPQILGNQLLDGSFRNVGGGHKINAVAAAFAGSGEYSEIYRTALCTLILESYYRRNPLTLE